MDDQTENSHVGPADQELRRESDTVSGGNVENAQIESIQGQYPARFIRSKLNSVVCAGPLCSKGDWKTAAACAKCK